MKFEGVLRRGILAVAQAARSAQRQYSLRSVFNVLRWRVRSGTSWRLLPNDLLPWWTVQQQAQRWIQAGCSRPWRPTLRRLLRWAANPEHLTPTSAILDRRTLPSTPESGARAGYDGYQRRKGSKIHAAVDRLGQLLAWHVNPPTNRTGRRWRRWWRRCKPKPTSKSK